MLLLSLLLRLLLGGLVCLFLLLPPANCSSGCSRSRTGAGVSSDRADSGPAAATANRATRYANWAVAKRYGPDQCAALPRPAALCVAAIRCATAIGRATAVRCAGCAHATRWPDRGAADRTYRYQLFCR